MAHWRLAGFASALLRAEDHDLRARLEEPCGELVRLFAYRFGPLDDSNAGAQAVLAAVRSEATWSNYFGRSGQIRERSQRRRARRSA